MNAPKTVGYRLIHNRIEAITRDAAISEFQAATRANMISPFKTLDDNERRERADAQLAARDKLQAARYYAIRDASEANTDRANDPNYRRQQRRFSLTRDMIEGPRNEVPFVDFGESQHFQHPIRHSTVGHDRQFFIKETAMLRAAGLVTDSALPDWSSDESIGAFFTAIHNEALTEAQTARTRGGTNRVIDAAPGLFLFAELLRQSERLVVEDFNKLWARSVFSVLNLNTWLPQWLYSRFDERSSFPMPVDVEQLPAKAPRGSENRAPVPRPLLFFQHAASWTELELARYAEAIANGALNIDLSQKRIDRAIHMCNWHENLIAFHGNDDLDLHGLLSAEAKTGIARVPSGGGFGSSDEEYDRQLLTRETKAIIEEVQQSYSPDTILLPTKPWLYVTDKRYGDLANPSGQTVIEAAQQTLEKLGVRDIMWVPEVGYNAKEKLRLQQHGMAEADAEKLAGGIDGEQCMVTMNRSADVCELVVAKERVMYPGRETRTDRVEARMLQGTGGMVFYKPASIRITTNVGPA